MLFTLCLMLPTGILGLFPPAMARSDMFSLDAPSGGYKITRNPVLISGSVKDSSIQTVYINKIDTPVIVMGRERHDLPGVPFPVVNGRFTGYAAYLGVGQNTVRLTALDGAGVRYVSDVSVEYRANPADRPDVTTIISIKHQRVAQGRRAEIAIELRNKTAQTQNGNLEVNLTSPTGNTSLVGQTAYTLKANQNESSVWQISPVSSSEAGVCKVTASASNTQGSRLSSDEAYYEVYRPEQYPFVDVSDAAGIHYLHVAAGEGGGASWADYDNDGRYDLFVTSMKTPAKVYHNDGNGTFTDVTESARLTDATLSSSTRAGIWGDYDNDGYSDLFVTSPGGFDRLYHNNRDGTFSDVTSRSRIRAKLNSYGAAWGDYDNDGLLDLYISGSFSDAIGPDFQVIAHPNQLYHNNGDGTFGDVAAQFGVADEGPTLACQWIDYDEDGDVDLFVINDYSAFSGFPGTIYRNGGPDGVGGWKFTNVGDQTKVHDVHLFGMGLAVADYDGDGDQDFFETNIGIPALFRNDGGVFTDQTFAAGVSMEALTNGPYFSPGLPSGYPGQGWLANTWGAQFWDYDLDGWPDFYVASSGMGTENFPIAPFNPNWMFRNNRNGMFTNVAVELGLNHPGRTRGVAMADYDNDGDLDIYLANNDEYGALLRNDFKTDNNWIKIKLRGTVSNRDAIGSKVTLTTGGRTQTILYPNSDPSCSQPAPELVVGLGKAAKVDSLTIRWPRGRITTLRDIDTQSLDKSHTLLVLEPKD